jgi:hypothetical protein
LRKTREGLSSLDVTDGATCSVSDLVAVLAAWHGLSVSTARKYIAGERQRLERALEDTVLSTRPTGVSTAVWKAEVLAANPDSEVQLAPLREVRIHG